jgi:20S proteasome alpha/beta subunit
MYELKESRQIRPKTFANMVSNLMYERRYVDKVLLYYFHPAQI